MGFRLHCLGLRVQPQEASGLVGGLAAGRQTKASGGRAGVHIWVVVKIRGPFLGYPKKEVPFCNRDPERCHNFDNHPYAYMQVPLLWTDARTLCF